MGKHCHYQWRHRESMNTVRHSKQLTQEKEFCLFVFFTRFYFLFFVCVVVGFWVV